MIGYTNSDFTKVKSGQPFYATNGSIKNISRAKYFNLLKSLNRVL